MPCLEFKSISYCHSFPTLTPMPRDGLISLSWQTVRNVHTVLVGKGKPLMDIPVYIWNLSTDGPLVPRTHWLARGVGDEVIDVPNKYHYKFGKQQLLLSSHCCSDFCWNLWWLSSIVSEVVCNWRIGKTLLEAIETACRIDVCTVHAFHPLLAMTSGQKPDQFKFGTTVPKYLSMIHQKHTLSLNSESAFAAQNYKFQGSFHSP